ncbi:uncharacterized protein G2W53_000816 [Senna tora]|uniref:Reverse transcriptase domain-containing protein n=1 Tax=Senna tora TaxID=362788 RepID=A0A835CI23_9FABA|nr:uncharacterized protein G2W53_000816 [Senna tora]
MLKLQSVAISLNSMGYDKCVAVSREGTHFYFTCVYGHPRLAEKAILWDYLQQKASVIKDPWLIFGDFNQVSSSSEKLSNSISIAGADQLKDFITNADLIDVHAQGNWYTWHKGRLGEAAVWERLDKTFCNVAWLQNFPQTRVYSLASFCSDHSPMDIQQSLVNFQSPPPSLLIREKEIRKDLEDKLAKEELLWAQKARQLWLVEGDRNMKYFHAIVKKWRMINQFTKIRAADGEWTRDYFEMETLAIEYFKVVYTHQNKPQRAEIEELLDSVEVPSLNQKEKIMLAAPITHAEIEQALFLMKPDKAPGPDGLPAMFLQCFWPVVKNDLITCIKSFFDRGFILRELNQTLITLIPKNQCPEQFKDFRPISLCNVIVKIISKVLVIRMQAIMERVIAPNQNGFVKGRAISDSILLASELMTFVHKARKVKTKWCAFKLDIQKAYDKLSWDFLQAVMIKMAFPTNVIQVIMQYVTTVSYSLMLNGQQVGSFCPQRGILQGDPLSPYLFLLCSNILSCMLHKEERAKNIQGIQFDPHNCSSIKRVLEKYATLADLFNELVEKVESKLAGWKSRLLSQIGRLTLIKSVLQASPIYQLSVLPMPNKYADRIDALSTNFYWGHNNKSGIHLAAKQKLFKSRVRGGLGLRQTSLFNKALMAKQVWRVVSQPASVYSQWARAKYFSNNLELLPKKTTQPAAIWRCLDKSGSLIFDHLWWKIATGEQVPLGSRFWWPLLTNYPFQHQNVAALINSQTRTWNQPLVNQLFAPSVASNILHSPLPLCTSADSFIWKFSITGEYKVSEGYQLLSDTRHQNNPSQFFPWKYLWSLSIPSKIKNFIWRILNNALPNLTNLTRHHMQLDEICCICQRDSESLHHLFIHCTFARSIWFGSCLALRIEQFPSTDLQQCLVHWFLQAQTGNFQEVDALHVKLICLHNIWYARNKFYMEGTELSPIQTIQKIHHQYSEIRQAYARVRIQNFASHRICNSKEIGTQSLQNLDALLIWKVTKGPRKYIVLLYQQHGTFKSIALGYHSITTIVFEKQGHLQLIFSRQDCNHSVLQQDII